MGVELPRNSRELLPFAGVAAVRRATGPSVWWVAGFVGVLATYAVLAYAVGAVGATSPGSGYVVLTTLPWVLAALLAAGGWGHAARQAEARPRAAFRLFQLAAAVGLIGHVTAAYEVWVLGTEGLSASSYLLLAPHLLVAAGAALALGSRRDRLWGPSLAADASLLVLAGLVGALRLVVEPSLAARAPDQLATAVLAILQAVAVVPVLLAALVVLRRGSALSPRSAALLLLATVALGMGALVSLSAERTGVLAVGAGGYSVWLVGWILFAASGYVARNVPATARAMLDSRKSHDVVRRLLVPGTAVFLALVVLDMGLGQPPLPTTVVAVAVLALVLAFRTAQAFRIADREAERDRQLAHTRALVDVTHSLADTSDLDAMLAVISDAARSVFGTRGAGIELLTEDGASLETRAVTGLPGNVVGLRFPVEGSFTGWVVRHGEPRATVDPSRDPYVQPQSLAFLGRWPVAAAPVRFQGETLGALFTCIRGEPFDAEELELLGALAQQAAIGIQQARLLEQVTTLSNTDPLTGLANRRQLDRELAREFAAARRGRPLAAAIFDIDEFKSYNDAYGHLAGDRAIQALARALQHETRAMNLAARYGGDEFVALLAEADLAGARVFSERVRTRFAALAEDLGHGPLTASAGVAEFSPAMADAYALIRAADDQLYRTKERVST